MLIGQELAPLSKQQIFDRPSSIKSQTPSSLRPRFSEHQSPFKMSRPAIFIPKFIGAISLGLLTVSLFLLSTTQTPPLLIHYKLLRRLLQPPSTIDHVLTPLPGPLLHPYQPHPPLPPLLPHFTPRALLIPNPPHQHPAPPKYHLRPQRRLPALRLRLCAALAETAVSPLGGFDGGDCESGRGVTGPVDGQYQYGRNEGGRG